jgi:signal transduction histidine kinase
MVKAPASQVALTGRFRSMRSRMTALFALLVALLMLGGGGEMQHLERERAEARVAEALQISLDRARDELKEKRGSRLPLVEVVRRDQGQLSAGGTALLVVDSSNHPLWQSSRDAPDWPEDDEEWRVRTLSSGGQTLVVARQWAPIEEELRERRRALWQLGALVVGVTGLLAWFVVGRTLSPLHKLAAQAENASIDSLQVRLQSPSSDAEMRHLTHTLNSLLGRLEKEAQGRGRFYAAASHELRTPLQMLLGEIDVARSRPRSVEEHEEVLLQVQGGTERLAVLVQDLLQLNALEMRQNQAPLEPINLAFWVERALAQQSESIEARGLTLETRLMDANLEAPSAHVEMLLRNLVENAVKYATPGTDLHVELLDSPDKARFEICNACKLPPGARADEWFEPFFRPDASRSSQTGGNGLGLAICRSICASNGWKITLCPGEQGVCAFVRFGKK